MHEHSVEAMAMNKLTALTLGMVPFLSLDPFYFGT
jgi:hypothetical protein